MKAAESFAFDADQEASSAAVNQNSYGEECRRSARLNALASQGLEKWANTMPACPPMLVCVCPTHDEFRFFLRDMDLPRKGGVRYALDVRDIVCRPHFHVCAWGRVRWSDSKYELYREVSAMVGRGRAEWFFKTEDLHRTRTAAKIAEIKARPELVAIRAYYA